MKKAAWAILISLFVASESIGVGINPYPLLSINGDTTPNQTFITANAATAYITSNGAGVTTFYFPTGGGGGGSGTVTSVSVASANGLSGTVSNPTTTPALTLSTSVTGVLKGDGTSISAQSTGNLSDGTADGISVAGGSGAVLGSGTTITQQAATAVANGYLTSTNWSTFNAKQAAGNYMTALTGDGSAAGPGSSALTLSTVNSNVGAFSPATVTVNAKGLVTAASSLTTTGTGNVVLSASPTLTGTAIFATISTAAATSYGYHMEPLENNAGNSSTAQTIDWSVSSSQLSTLTGNVTYAFTNARSAGTFVLRIATGTGAFTMAWPASVQWLNSTNTPPAPGPASKTALVSFYFDGSTFWGNYATNY